MFPSAGRLHRRAILIYLATIVAPACGLLWLGIQSFERQRQALATLTAEKLEAELDTRTHAAAERAFADPRHPIAKHVFTIEHGVVIRPALHAPPPQLAPPEFTEAGHQELTLNRPDLALTSYRTLLAQQKLKDDVLTAASGDAAVADALREQPDLVLLDVMLPVMSGLEVCRELRQKNFDAPIIMLTAKAEDVDRVVGLEIGADDYVVKPFGIRELLARIHVRLRRRGASGQSDAVLRFDEVEVNFEKYEVMRNGSRVELTPKEFDVLRLLARRGRHVVTRDRLLEEVWGYEHYPTTRTVDNHILRLRQKLEANPSDPRHILSIYGEGYKFIS